MKFKITLFDIATILFSVFCLFPLLTSMNLFRFIVVIASIYILLISFNIVVKKGSVSVLLLIISLSIASFIYYLLENKYGVNFFIHFTHLVLFIFIYEYYRIKDIKTMKNSFYVLLFFLFISIVQTIIEVSSNMEYARYLAQNQDEIEVVGLSGGYGLIYAVMLVLLSIFSFHKRKIVFPIINRFFLLIIAALIGYLIWKAGYFLALLITIFGVLLLVVGIKKNNIPIVSFILIFIFGILSFFQDFLSNQILESTYGTKYQTKVQSIIEPNSISQFDDEFSERESRYSRDLQLMIDYPIVGCWDFKLIGKHSFILDMLAEFGLVFGATFIYFLFIIPFRIMRKSEHIAFTQSFVFFCGLLLFLLLNSFPISLLPVIFIIFPYSNYVISKQWRK